MAGNDDVRSEIKDFLTTRRGRITPEQAGLPHFGGRRRVPGLRREELALLAGISIEYLTRIERGNVKGVSDEVLESLARALQLDDVERGHLMDLVQTASTSRPPRRRPTPYRVRPSVQRVLDSMTGAAAFVRNGRLDILGTNHLGRALYAPVLGNGSQPTNLARFVFLNHNASDFYADWDGIANATVGSLRDEAGRDPFEKALTDLIGELSTRSEEFRVRWAAHNVKQYRTGVQPFHHPVIGDLALDYNALELPGDPGQTIVAYTAQPDSPAQQALDLLASWAATNNQPSSTTQAHHS